MKSIRKYRTVLLFIIDILIIASAYLVTAYLTTDNVALFTNKYKDIISNTILISLVVYEIIFGIFNIYKNITRYETLYLYSNISLFSFCCTANNGTAAIA